VIRLSAKLSDISSGKLALVALVLFVLFMALVLPAQAGVSSRELPDVGSPDMSFIYSADDAYGWAGAYGPEGRAAYVQARWSFDLAWPVVYGFFLVTSISWVSHRAYRPESRAHLLNLVPLAAVALDYSENILATVVMLRYPQQAMIAGTLMSPVTVVKWLCVGGSFVALFAAMLVWAWRLLLRSPAAGGTPGSR
jgi:hypothetical protein